MLAKILEEMWVEPEVLEALSEEQKRILFLKMREEQVRRWRVREETEEREAGETNTRAKKVSRKHVQWLLGRDGDVSVTIIGEMDEFRSSKLLQNLMNNRLHGDNMNGIQTVDFVPGREARELGFRAEVQLPLADVGDYLTSPSDHTSSEEEVDDDLKEPTEDSDSESGGSSDGHWACRERPGFRGNQPQLSETESVRRQDRETVSCCEEKGCEVGGRVAQLRKAFAVDNTTADACSKPPLPAKPAHLQKGNVPLIR